MEILRIIVNIVLLMASALLITVVLMQSTKSAGLGSAFGGDSPSFTARGKAASKDAKLQKITKYTAIALGILSLAMAVINSIAS